MKILVLNVYVPNVQKKDKTFLIKLVKWLAKEKNKKNEQNAWK